MEGVTDTVFRQVILSLKRPDLFYTEFVNVDGLNSEGKDSVIHRLRYSKEEKPIIAQLWGSTPKNFLKSSEIIYDMGFDGVDINMGCSVKNVVKNCAGSGLINEDRKSVRKIIEAVREGSNGLPISVKTRLGFNDIDMEWIKFLLNQNLNTLTIHMRTARGTNSIHANWEYMKEIVNLRNEINPNTLLFGNGDIKSVEEGIKKTNEYGIEGVLIGREAVSNPWIFTQLTYSDISVNEKIEAFKKHLMLFDKVWEKDQDFNTLKKFFRTYINNFNNASEIRAQLMMCNSSKEILKVLKKYSL